MATSDSRGISSLVRPRRQGRPTSDRGGRGPATVERGLWRLCARQHPGLDRSSCERLRDSAPRGTLRSSGITEPRAAAQDLVQGSFVDFNRCGCRLERRIGRDRRHTLHGSCHFPSRLRVSLERLDRVSLLRVPRLIAHGPRVHTDDLAEALRSCRRRRRLMVEPDSGCAGPGPRGLVRSDPALRPAACVCAPAARNSVDAPPSDSFPGFDRRGVQARRAPDRRRHRVVSLVFPSGSVSRGALAWNRGRRTL